ncbi:DUF4190 domain-containing protein [Petropleomorpha daqingensis]|uniref:DUF4190 domain-containing protein n=1 Tax=Petropleomorpha daqingensis TaxID=2026353 RepID=A0A853CF45_9ACTN|nr:DUF4190 domain-containing protein [Petropleomorpha daqingensis]NYJ06605.1 hypothetical protein [Petropleomorpha daqingensis]
MAQDTRTTTQQGNGLAIAGLVCGIVGLLFFNVILGPLAIIFGGIGWSKANKGARHRGMAIAAVVLGILDLVIWGVLLAVAAHNGGFMHFQIG